MKIFNYQMGGREPFKFDEVIQLSNGTKGNLLILMKTFNYQLEQREPFKSDEDIQLSNGTKQTF